jgi:23S rRNA (uracil1939-C5)-methyltransferase
MVEKVFRAQIVKATADYAEARLLQLIQDTELAVPVQCPYFSDCGGCSHQNLAYPEQLKILGSQVLHLYHHLGGFEDVIVAPPLPATEIFRYRNKMEFAFSNQRWLMGDFEQAKPLNFALGLRPRRNYWKVIDIDDCLIAPPETLKILQIVRQYVLEKQLVPYDQKKHQGFLRHLIIRKGERTNQLMVNLVTQTKHPDLLMPLADQLCQAIPNLTSVLNSVTTTVSGTTYSEITELLRGEAYITEKLDSLTFQISPHSFFQTNTLMAEKLYRTVMTVAQLSGTEIIWDLYGGTGSIALYLARQAAEVFGFEIVPEAVWDARINAELNQIRNVHFYLTNLDKIQEQESELLSKLAPPDVLILDPPRGGVHPRLLQYIGKLKPPKIIYVSCNAATQVRDLQLLIQAANYQIESVQPVDLFPHTPHIEVVAQVILV